MTETLEQFGERIAKETRSALMSKLPDDVIGHIRESHLVFGKACVIAAITFAMESTAAARLAAVRTDADEIADPRCRCPTATVERVIRDHGTCGMGGCPYGGDI